MVVTMLRSLRDLQYYTVTATNGDVGKVVNFLFDDERWSVRYLVVDTGGLFNRHEVLVSPISFSEVERPIRRVHLSLTKEKIENGPSVDSAKTAGASPMCTAETWTDLEPLSSSPEQPRESYLRSASEVQGYDIQAIDGSIGHVDDFIVEDIDWEVRYLVIDTSNWWFGKKVLVAPQWADQLSWEDKKVGIGLSQQAIKNSPEWDSTKNINREYEAQLYDHYKQPGYWERGSRSQRQSQPSESDYR